MNLCGFQLRDDKAGLLWLDFPSAYTVEDLDLVATTLGKYLEDHAPQGFGIRLGLRMIKGMPQEDGEWVVGARAGPWVSQVVRALPCLPNEAQMRW